MKVFYDHQIFTVQKYGGISRYFYELMNRFDNQNNQIISSSILSNNEYLRYSKNTNSHAFFPNNNFPGKSRFMNVVNKFNSNRILTNSNFDIFHPTFFDPYFLKFIGKKPFVLTVHDLINEKFINQFEYLKLEEKITNDKHLLMKQASKIIAVSETTKKDIIDYYQIDGNKIEVIYHGNSLFKKPLTRNSILNFEYVLFVGKRSMYKNFLFTIESVHQLLKKYKLKFVCFGGSKLSKVEIKLIHKLELQDYVIHIDQIDDQLLQNLYINAVFFIFPSMYEGFGIPLLEAFGCECPVLSSEGGSLKEVGGDAAIYFDPFDSQSIYDMFLMMIERTDIRKKCIELGKIRLNNFSWDDTFNKTLSVYKSLE
jgi:glycosyltransferase involved in cell wall biosynthesis